MLGLETDRAGKDRRRRKGSGPTSFGRRRPTNGALHIAGTRADPGGALNTRGKRYGLSRRRNIENQAFIIGPYHTILCALHRAAYSPVHLNFRRSPSTISFSIFNSRGRSHLQLTHRPPKNSLRSLVRNGMECADSSGLSLIRTVYRQNTLCGGPTHTYIAIPGVGWRTGPSARRQDGPSTPRHPSPLASPLPPRDGILTWLRYSSCTNSVNLESANFETW